MVYPAWQPPEFNGRKTGRFDLEKADQLRDIFLEQIESARNTNCEQMEEFCEAQEASTCPARCLLRPHSQHDVDHVCGEANTAYGAVSSARRMKITYPTNRCSEYAG